MAQENIVAHLPGIFYQKASPEADPFKSPEQEVVSGDVIGLIEVMKSYHEVVSTVDGTFNNYSLENGEAVMPGQAVAAINI